MSSSRGRIAIGAICVLSALLLLGGALTTAAKAATSTDPTTLLGGGESWAENTVRPLLTGASGAGALGTLTPQYISDRGEDAGRKDVATGAADYSVAEAPMTSAEVATATQNGITPAYVPFAEGAVAIIAAVTVSTLHGGGLVTNLKLTIPTLAKIFTHHITSWNDAEILAENPQSPSLAFPATDLILTVVRTGLAGGNSESTTALVSMFLADPVARPIWETYAQGLGQAPDATPASWPDDPGGNVDDVTGTSRDVINAVLNLNPATGLPNAIPDQSIGYVSPGWAAQFNAPMVAIQNEATPPMYVLPTATGAVATAVSTAASFNPTTNLYSIDYTKITAAGAYPLPLVSYLIVPVIGDTRAKATALANLIKLLGTAGQAMVTSTGMVAVTAAAVTAGLAAAAALTNTSTSSTSTTATTVPRSGSTNTLVQAVATKAAGGSDLPATGGWPSAPLTAAGIVLVLGGEALRRRHRRSRT